MTKSAVYIKKENLGTPEDLTCDYKEPDGRPHELNDLNHKLKRCEIENTNKTSKGIPWDPAKLGFLSCESHSRPQLVLMPRMVHQCEMPEGLQVRIYGIKWSDLLKQIPNDHIYKYLNMIE